jgi:hypothetical protein
LVAAAQKKGTAEPASSSTKQAVGTAKKESPAFEIKKLVVYYFHGSARCRTCTKFETLTKEVMDESFADEVKKGRVEFRAVNVDDKENEHYVRDYQLYSRSVVLSDTKDGKQVGWKNLEEIWNKVRDEEIYKNYIRDEVASVLKAG